MCRVKRAVRKRKATKHGRGLKPKERGERTIKCKARKKGKKVGGNRIGLSKPRLKSLVDHKRKRDKDKRRRHKMKGQESWRGGDGPYPSLRAGVEIDRLNDDEFVVHLQRGIDVNADHIKGDSALGGED